MKINNNIENLRLPPQSIEAEQCVLGGLMIRNEAYDEIVDKIFEDVFYRAEHKLIFKAISDLHEKEKPADVITVAEILESRGKLEDVGKLEYIGSLVLSLPSASNIKAYIDIVHEKYLLRSAINIGTVLADSAFDPGDRSVDEIIDAANRSIIVLSDPCQNTGPQPASAYISDVISDMDDRATEGGATIGLKTGFQWVDNASYGFPWGLLTVIAGRPSQGKTAFAMNAVENVAIKSKQAVLVFTLETTSKDLINRMASSISGIPFDRIMTGKMMDSDWPKFTEAIRVIKEAPLFFDETPAINYIQIRARARKLKRQFDIKLIMVDFLQLMSPVDTRINSNMHLITSANTKALKALAKELNVCVLCLSQLNRNVEHRSDKRPIMSDLKESGAIEEDAQLLMFMYRDEKYNPAANNKGFAEVIIAKNKSAETTTVYLTAELEKMRFRDYFGVPQYAQFNKTNQGFD